MEDDREFNSLIGGTPQLKPKLWKLILIILGGCMVSLMSERPATRVFTVGSIDFRNYQLNLIAGLGMIGLYFAIPAGYVILFSDFSSIALDKFGPLRVSLFGTALIIIGYVSMSFTTHQTWYLTLISFSVAGFGCGFTFLSALGASISISPTYIAVLTAILALPGSLLLWFFNPSEYPHLMKAQRQNEIRPKQKPWEILKVFLQPFFLVLFATYFAGIGASVFILTQSSQLWKEINRFPDLEGFPILLIFSISNAVNNFISGVLSDFLNKRKILSHQKYVGICMGIFSLVFITVGILFRIFPNPSRSVTILIGVLLGVQGIGFGVYAVLFPVVVASSYGANDFGKYFSILQISSSLASVIIPEVTTAAVGAARTYSPMLFAIGSLLFVSCVLLLIPWKTPASLGYQKIN